MFVLVWDRRVGEEARRIRKSMRSIIGQDTDKRAKEDRYSEEYEEYE